MNNYPHTPGWRGKGLSGLTSAQAAIAMHKDAKILRRIALRTLSELGSATRLECCEKAEVEPRRLEPRFSELKERGLIEENGLQKLNRKTGKMNSVLRLTDAGRAAL
jgi:predicted HTH transcriptional regulator